MIILGRKTSIKAESPSASRPLSDVKASAELCLLSLTEGLGESHTESESSDDMEAFAYQSDLSKNPRICP